MAMASILCSARLGRRLMLGAPFIVMSRATYAQDGALTMSGGLNP